MSTTETESLFWRVLGGIFDFLSSVKLAVVVLLSLAASLAVGTILESLYDTPTSQFFVYRSLWFHGILALLGVNIFCSAVSRYPWKKRHAPFLVAHIGILTMLAGSWVTERYGLDGSLRVTEGDTASVVESDTYNMIIVDNNEVKNIPVKWIPPGVHFTPFTAASRGFPYDVKVDDFYSHADPNFSFVPSPSNPASVAPAIRKAALKMRIKGGPMGISQEFWLWQGDPNWSRVSMGPANFAFINKGDEAPKPTPGRTLLVLTTSDGKLGYQAYSSDGKLKEGEIPLEQIARGEQFSMEPGWKTVKLDFEIWIPTAVPFTEYKLARTLYGSFAPPRRSTSRPARAVKARKCG